MRNNYYYSETLTEDPEGSLVALCAECAAMAVAGCEDVIWAGAGDPETICELCGAEQEAT